ncbi:MAG: two-component system, NarL family, response regulator DevR [Microbacteriaceae bacterium]|nr:two-component system, NarL family, response regulator DevR [Microbacteriaceae bacterium]
MRALIVDDHPIARRGLAALLREAFKIEDIIEVDTARAAISAASVRRPELVLIDLRIPGVPRASELCAQLRSRLPQSRIAIITAFNDPLAIKHCLAAGADGCMLKDSSTVDMLAALRSLARGERMIDPRIAQTLANELVSVLRGEAQTVQLTIREREVLDLLAEGCSNRMIAERLFIAETTVKGYVRSLLQKLGASSRLQAVIRATEQGLL